MLQYVVRQSTEVEARFNSVERLLEYITVRSLSCHRSIRPGLLDMEASQLSSEIHPFSSHNAVVFCVCRVAGLRPPGT